MVQALDKENHTTILKDMIEQAELKGKHKHLLQLEKSTIEERIDTAVPQENDGIFNVIENFRFSQQRVIFIPYMERKRKMNFFIKSATKQLLAYRYGARKGNLNFFENRSLNQGLLSLYDVKEEKVLKNDGNS